MHTWNQYGMHVEVGVNYDYNNYVFTLFMFATIRTWPKTESLLLKCRPMV